MTKPTHQAFSLMVTGSACIILRKTGMALTAPAVIGTIAVASFGCLLPDADEPNSWIGRHLPILCLPLWLFRGIVKLLSLLVGSRTLDGLATEFGHRHFLHYPSTYIGLFGIGYIILRLTTYRSCPFPVWLTVIAAGLIAGIMSHIVGDAIFGEIALLAPISKRKFSLSPFRTGGLAEKVSLGLMVFADIKKSDNISGGL